VSLKAAPPCIYSSEVEVYVCVCMCTDEKLQLKLITSKSLCESITRKYKLNKCLLGEREITYLQV